jgi:hypothetical protein
LILGTIPFPVGAIADRGRLRGIMSASEDSSFIDGSVPFVDGGTDALVRPDTF